MRATNLLLFLLLSACAALAQSGAVEVHDPSEALRKEHWNFGLWADYGNGVGTRTDVHVGGAGFRIGRVMTGEHGSGWARGTFETDADLTPVEIYHFPATLASGYNVPVAAQNFYSGGVTPLIVKWNFTRGHRWVPFVAAEGGIVFSNKDMPPGDTANVNFTSGAAFGVHHFGIGKSAWTFQGKVFHLSNASLGPHNPGVNAAVQFKIGYSWFKW
jgi:lipid A 3-O-deacylase